jgi:hypothetical protein
MRKSFGACCALLALLTGCLPSGSDFHTEHTSGATVFYVAGLALTTPPVNTIVFGPCREEFGMPDSRRANCELRALIASPVTGHRTPWEERAKFYAATDYQPGELTCWRTLGKIAECAVVTGPPRRAPYLVQPNTLGSE